MNDTVVAPAFLQNILTAVLTAALARRPVGWPDKMDFSIIVFELSPSKILVAGSLSSADCKAHLLVWFFLAGAKVVVVLVAPNGLATRDCKTTAMLSWFCPFQSKSFARVMNVHDARRTRKGRQGIVQFNGSTDRWTDGSIHEYSPLADVSSAPLPVSDDSLTTVPRESSGQLQWIANSPSALHRRPPPDALSNGSSHLLSMPNSPIEMRMGGWPSESDSTRDRMSVGKTYFFT
jgi:hypothetical protein